MGWNQRNEEYRALHEAFAEWIVDSLQVRTSLEIGCGPGYLLAVLNALGVYGTGTDGNEFSKDFFDAQHPEFSGHYVLDPLFGKRYAPVDAIIAIEVFEHIPDAGLHHILRRIRSELTPRFIVFSSTPHADPDPQWDFQWGHINIKQPDQWHALFREYGYELTTARPPVTEWACLYVDTRQI